jgi:plastocyanin
MAENQVYLIKSGQNSFVEETEAVVGISGGKVGIGTTVPEADLHVAGGAQIDGDLTVKGNFTTVSETTVSIDDKNIELGVVDSPTDLTADGGGITLKGTTDKTIAWRNDNGAWNFSEGINVSGSAEFSEDIYVGGQPVFLWQSSEQSIDTEYNVDISGDGSNYTFSGDFEGQDPAIKLFVGESITFNNIGGGHVLAIKDATDTVVASESSGSTVFTPAQEGVYTYYCVSHPSTMLGTISVSVYKEVYYTNGRVAIGKVDPSYNLDVVGSGNFSQGLYVNGNSVLTGSAADLGKWDEGAGSEIFYNQGNVGVGTSAPAYTVDVVGSGNFSQGLYVDGNSVLTGSVADLGKWDEGAGSEIFYNQGNVGVGTSDPAYALDVVGQGNFSQGLYVDGNSVLTGSADDLSKWTEGASSEVYYKDGNVGVGTSAPNSQFEVVGNSLFNGDLNVGSSFSVSTNGSIGGTLPTSAGQVVTWDGLKWKPANAAAGGGGSSEVPVAFVQALASGQSDYTINFSQTYDSVPAISTDIQIDGEGAIIPYAISDINTSGYTISFAKALPNNNYKIHTNFGGRDVYWTTGELGSINYSGGDVNIQNSLAVGASLTVQGSPVLTGSAADLGKWEEGAGSKIYYNDGNVGIGVNNPAYSLHVNGTIYNENGGINVANKFNVSTLGAVGGQSPAFNEVIKWDGTKWIAGSAPGGGAASSSEVPNAFDTWLSEGSAIQAITFVDAPEGGYQSIPSISTDIEIVDGDIIPYAISGVSTTGYYAVFSDPIPTANNYKIHTTFGGKEVYWKTGAGGSSIYYDGDSVSVDDLVVGGNLTVNGTTTTVNTQTVEIEDHNLVIAANTGYNQLTSEYPGAGGAYAGILWGTGDAGGASPVKLTYQTNKGFAFEGGNVGIGTTNPAQALHVASSGATSNGIRISNSEGSFEARVDDGEFYLYDVDDTRIPFLIDTSGNIGIGTSSASQLLTVDGNISLGTTTGAGKLYLSSSTGFSPRLQEASNALAVYTDNIERMRITSGGNVGIGTTNPGERLHIEGASPSIKIKATNQGGLAEIKLQSDAGDNNADLWSIRASNNQPADNHLLEFMSYSTGSFASALAIDSNGNVGIGTTNPYALLDIRGPNAVGTFFQAMTAGVAGVNFKRVNQSSSPYNHFLFHNGNVGIGTLNPTADLHINSSDTATTADDSVSSLRFQNGDSFNNSVLINGRTDVSGATDYTDRVGLMIATRGQERMRITSVGNVGIGTPDPGSYNFVLNSSAADSRMKISSSNSSAATIFFGEDAGAGGTPAWIQRFGSTHATKPSKVEIGAAGSGSWIAIQGDGGDILNVRGTGRVGIGTTNPGKELHVNGTILFEKGGGADNAPADPVFLIAGNGYHGQMTADSNAFYIGQNSTIRELRMWSGSLSTGVKLTNGSTSWGTYSDEKLKTNITDIGSVLDKISGIRCVNYQLIHDESSQKRIGFIAQDFVDKFDEVVQKPSKISNDIEGEYLGLKYTEIIPVIMKAVQEQQQIIESQDNKINQQQTTIDQLITRIETLENK